MGASANAPPQPGHLNRGDSAGEGVAAHGTPSTSKTPRKVMQTGTAPRRSFTLRGLFLHRMDAQINRLNSLGPLGCRYLWYSVRPILEGTQKICYTVGYRWRWISGCVGCLFHLMQGLRVCTTIALPTVFYFRGGTQ